MADKERHNVNTSFQSDSVAERKDEYFSILDLLIVTAKHKRKLLLAPLVAGVLAAGATFLVSNVYTATVQLLPPQNQSGASALLGQLGGALGGLAGGALTSGKTTNETYIGMLGSRTVSDELIKKFDLARVYETDYPSDTRKVLKNMTTFINSRDGMIIIEVDDREPKRAADIANAYAESLKRLTQNLAVTDAARRRLFFQNQLDQAKKSLAEAEVALRQTQEKTGLIQLSGQAQGIIEAAASLKASIASKEVVLRGMRTFATGNNPDYLRAEQELAGLRAQLAKVETAPNAGNGDISIATAKVPAVALEYARRLRDVKYFESVFEVLAKQVELAKIEEAKDSAVVQVLDPAVVPDKKSKPRRSLVVLITMLVALVFTFCWVLVRELIVSSKTDQDNAERFNQLSRNMSWRNKG